MHLAKQSPNHYANSDPNDGTRIPSGNELFMRFTSISLLLLLSGCTALPQAGPSTGAIESKQSNSLSGGYELIKVDDRIVSYLNNQQQPSFRGLRSTVQTLRNGTIGTGDIVAVTIWEASAGGLFSDALTASGGGAKHTTLPEQPVSARGTISIPYGGEIRVTGRTPEEAQRLINQALNDKAVDPQALLVVTKSIGSGVTVAGEVGSPGRIPLPTYGGTLLDLLASAGGYRAPVFETDIQLNRGKQVAKVPLSAVLENSSENIPIQAGDTITVTRDPKTFTVFGATGINNQIPFNSARLTLNEALGRAGGLSDLRADAKSVFVMRFETQQHVLAMTGKSNTAALGGRPIPVIYRVDLSDPGGLLISKLFYMHDEDIIYISNAPLAEFQKFVTMLNTAVQVPNTAMSTASTFYTP